MKVFISILSLLSILGFAISSHASESESGHDYSCSVSVSSVDTGNFQREFESDEEGLSVEVGRFSIYVRNWYEPDFKRFIIVDTQNRSNRVVYEGLVFLAKDGKTGKTRYAITDRDRVELSLNTYCRSKLQ